MQVCAVCRLVIMYTSYITMSRVWWMRVPLGFPRAGILTPAEHVLAHMVARDASVHLCTLQWQYVKVATLHT